LNETYAPYSRFLGLIQQETGIDELNVWFGKPAPVWIRAYRSRLSELQEYLNKRNIEARKEGDGDAFELPPNSAMNEAVDNGLCRIQDLSSQLSIDEKLHPTAELIWDACCGAGGKALRLCEAYPNARIYISDSRPAIVDNAESRFRLSRYPAPMSAVCDLKKEVTEMVFANGVIIKKSVFDMVICDVPCSGSGTWRRNPENLIQFNTEQIGRFAEMQRRIVKNTLPFLKPGGVLVYITCSVFAGENGDNVQKIATENGLQLLNKEVVGGEKKNADYLYRAVLLKP
jgi:16S rRNA (cytosine967-C5)-methyltransferase